jgi:hypothetical protein
MKKISIYGVIRSEGMSCDCVEAYGVKLNDYLSRRGSEIPGCGLLPSGVSINASTTNTSGKNCTLELGSGQDRMEFYQGGAIVLRVEDPKRIEPVRALENFFLGVEGEVIPIQKPVIRRDDLFI